MTTTATTQRLVNCSVAYLVTSKRNGSQWIEASAGSDGVPERSMDYCRHLIATCNYGSEHYRPIGVQITDVRTGEQWLWVA